MIMTLAGGYYVFLDDFWDAPGFVFSYFSVALFPALFFGWKLIKRTHWKKPHEVDLKGETEYIDDYTRNFRPKPSKNAFDKWFNVIFGGINYDKDLARMQARGSVSYDAHGKMT